MSGRKQRDKSDQGNHYPPGKPGDLDQFGQAMDKQRTELERERSARQK